jgi:CopG family nickel-responsive transcriptional regulator
MCDNASISSGRIEDYERRIAQHVHLDHHYCLEIIAVKGRAKEIQKLADLLRSQVGVKHVTLNATVAKPEKG